jgi:hypothetical protein
VHPIERLRHLARADGVGSALLVREAAGALASFGADPPGLVTACRRLIERHPTSGPIWWLASRMLSSAEPVAEAWRAADELDADTTAHELARRLPDDATVLVLGGPETAGESVRRRADLEVLVVDVDGEGGHLARRLRGAGIDALDVPHNGLGAAAAEADLVLLEASVLGPDAFVAPAGSRAAASVARQTGTTVWLAVGVGCALPAALWDAVADRLGAGDDEPWDRPEEIVPLSLVDEVIGPPESATPCPVAPELLKGLD